MTRGIRLILAGLKFAVELSLVVALYVGVVWGLMRLAEYRTTPPPRPEADGVVRLGTPEATLCGGLEFFEELEDRPALLCTLLSAHLVLIFPEFPACCRSGRLSNRTRSWIAGAA